MIRIQRPSEPEWWKGSWRGELRKRAKKFFAVPEGVRRQERFDWQGLPNKAAPPSLLAKLFHSKCAYCETRLESGLGGLELHRPRQNAIGTDDKASPDHYWWLAWEWRNVLLACRNCVSVKGSRFPVKGERASPESGKSALPAEEPLLLDPTVDEPAEHLRFASESPYLVHGLTERGKVTIEVLQLNRSDLLQARELAAEEALSVSLRSKRNRGGMYESNLVSPLADGVPHCALRRQLVAEALAKGNTPHERLASLGVLPPRLQVLLRPYFRPADQREEEPTRDSSRRSVPLSLSIPDRDEEPRTRTTRKARRSPSPTPPRPEPPPTQPSGPRYLRSISLHDFRGLQDLSLEFSFDTHPNSDQAPWLMLLGENGHGKSSVLQAVALALLPADDRRKSVADPRRLVRRGTASKRAQVRLELSSGQAVELTIDGERGRMLGTPPPVLLCAYGSTRLLPRGKHRPREGASAVNAGFAHAANLFDPFLPLLDAQAWLLAAERSERDRFDYAVAAIKAILDLANAVRFEPAEDGKEVEVHHAGPEAVALSQLSDGYQAMLALTVDVIARASAAQKVVSAAEGLVLVDELGLHMHPRWKLRVVAGLRRAFPRLQFLCTTHDPLCLRGLYKGEVAVMRRDEEGRIVALTKELPAVDALRVDQLLTSEYFGLETAMDPEMETRFAEYYHLLGLTQPDAKQTARLAALKQELAGKEVLGSSERERLMYEAIDGFLAQKTALKTDTARAALPAMKQGLLDELQRIWQEA